MQFYLFIKKQNWVNHTKYIYKAQERRKKRLLEADSLKVE
jgi:hypothetical protein